MTFLDNGPDSQALGSGRIWNGGVTGCLHSGGACTIGVSGQWAMGIWDGYQLAFPPFLSNSAGSSGVTYVIRLSVHRISFKEVCRRT